MRIEIYKHNWDFILYEEGNNKIFRVVFYQSFTDTSKEFILKGDELNYDFEQLKKLAEDIRNNYENYKDREITE
ncbi:hypothetical protein [Chryseobacterium chendengshani]|uniref:hypothetical protein n=1 Tax=Chryseobacterium sp. LJ756 TaxID=2864113 RepID=UPI001C6416D1|nr:hypothetical protein [Chryseobacterium sp. LJ756]MBW7675321.1 hypothetical protein [Chryseobacterium sp. LJ756]